MKATGTNTDSSTRVMPMIGAVICPMAFFVASAGVSSGWFLHHVLDVLDHDNGVVDHDTDRQHDGEQRHGVGGISDRLEHDEGADQADRHGEHRDQRGAQAAEEEEHDQDDEDKGLDQRLLHLMDRVGDEDGGVVGDLPGEIHGKALLQPRHEFSHCAERIDRVRARRLIDGDGRRRRTIEARLAVEVGGAELQPRHIAQPQDRAVRIGANDDVFEFGDGGQAALGRNVELQLLVVGDRTGADATDGGLQVLALNRVDDVAGRQVEAGQAVRLDPGADRVILRSPE